MKDLKARIDDIKAKTTELTRVENEYQTTKEIVADLWKQYWPAAKAKKELQEKRKILKAELQKIIEADVELKALISSLS